MQTQIINLLQCTEHQLDMLVFKHYQFWCELHAYTPTDLQRILANKQIEQWFQHEYQKLQNNFIAIATPYKGNCKKADMEKLYRAEVIKIADFYPRALLISVRKKSYKITGVINQ